MHRIKQDTARETGATSLEYVGIAVAAALLLGGAAVGMRGGSGSIGDGIATRLGAAIDGEKASGRWRTAHEVRTGGGSTKVRVSRDELRMSPVIDPLAVWSGSVERSATIAGARTTVDARACVLCGALEWSHGLTRGAATGSDGSSAGIGGELTMHGRAALASGELNARVERDIGRAGAAFAQGRVRGTLGGELDAAATARLSRGAFDAELEGGAMAGAVARAEARAGVDLFGVAIRQAGSVEGWAGAGVRGAAGVHVGGGVTSWRFGWGGALGIGGAGEWSGSVDASKVPATHRRLARDALLGAVRVASFPIASINPFPSH
jgi:hypothetical protein